MNVKANTWVEAQEGTNENSYQDQTIGWWGGAIYVTFHVINVLEDFNIDDMKMLKVIKGLSH